MSDVFISYARSTEPQARRVAEALRALGYGVWRDDELPAHRAYAEVIEERLKAAKAVVVIWSAEAAKSEWVQSEAEPGAGGAQAGPADRRRRAAADAVRPDPVRRPRLGGRYRRAGLAQGGRQRRRAGRRGGAQRRNGGHGCGGTRKLSVCVLPFANMSGDAEQEYFSDGISEDIITDLSKVSALSVVSRNSAFQFKGQHVDVRQVARQLKVSHVLEGSVRKAGNRVRITAQLIEGAREATSGPSATTATSPTSSPLQDEISQAIVAALRLRLLPEEKSAITRRGTASPEAYDLYLMARQHSVGDNNDVRGRETIVRLCGRAVEIDPGLCAGLGAARDAEDRAAPPPRPPRNRAGGRRTRPGARPRPGRAACGQGAAPVDRP